MTHVGETFELPCLVNTTSVSKTKHGTFHSIGSLLEINRNSLFKTFPNRSQIPLSSRLNHKAETSHLYNYIYVGRFLTMIMYMGDNHESY